MANWQGVETQKLVANGTAKSATFEGGIQGCYVVSDADCFIDFDNVAQSSSLLIKANQAPAQILFPKSNVTKVWAITGGATANVYLMGIRGGF